MVISRRRHFILSITQEHKCHLVQNVSSVFRIISVTVFHTFTGIKCRKWLSLREENEPDIFNCAGEKGKGKGQRRPPATR